MVVGAGPAGLSAAAELASNGIDVQLVDLGDEASARDRDDPSSVITGVGGAGLFSDGKFSFYPSASGLWSTSDRDLLDLARDRTDRFLALHEVSAIEPASRPDSASDHGPSRWTNKPYPSVYASLSTRAAMTRDLFSLATKHAPAWLHTRWRSVAPSTVRDHVELTCVRDGQPVSIVAKHVVLCLGRYTPILLEHAAPNGFVPRVFRRVEVGLRLEDSARSPLFSSLEGTDPKLIAGAPSDSVSWRTFCCCRDGEVVHTRFDGINSTSGRADGPRSGRSNLGINVRVHDRDLALAALPALIEGARMHPVSLPLWPLIRNRGGRDVVSKILGTTLANLAIDGLRSFVDQMPHTPSEHAVVHAPAIEGLGMYPNDDGALRVSENLWVAGDGTGRFRGIVAAMISGRLAAIQIARALR